VDTICPIPGISAMRNATNIAEAGPQSARNVSVEFKDVCHGVPPWARIDPTGLETIVIITRDPVPFTSGFLTYGSHAAVRVDNGTNPVLYDPAGSYLSTTRGSGDAFYGTEANLNSYISYQRST
jgi:hypothetical protein